MSHQKKIVLTDLGQWKVIHIPFDALQQSDMLAELIFNYKISIQVYTYFWINL